MLRSEFQSLFAYFLEEKANDWIRTSKIKDKSSHFEALEQYLNGLKDERALLKMRCLKQKPSDMEEAEEFEV